jgi:hypothetical protein
MIGKGLISRYLYDVMMLKALLKLLVEVAGIIAVIALCMIWPSRHWAGGAGVEAMSWAAVVCFFSAICSLVPIVVGRERKADWLIQVCLTATMIRLLVTVLAGFVVYLTVLKHEQIMFFLLSLAAFYLALLIWETFLVIRSIRILYPEPS